MHYDIRPELKEITIPLILPGILLAAILVFLLSFGEFGVPNFLRYKVFPVESFTQFSGHTHGGQCRVPLIGYAPVKVRYGEKYIEGHFEKSLDQQLYVSAGIGTVGLRVRFSCPPEIVLFTLKSIE